jgi:antitoxin YefM
METISYTDASGNLAAAMDKVCHDRVPLAITREGEPSVVMLSREEYESLEETAYLLQSPANAKRLLEAKQALEAGQGTVHSLDLEQ